MVVVKVGRDETVFRMHKTIICNVSPFFKAAFEGNFVEAQEQVLELLDESITMFKHFQLWVYTDSIITKGETATDVTWVSLACLYIFGEKCGIPDLQNMAIDVLIDKQQISIRMPISIIRKVYDDTPATAPLRRLLVDLMACKFPVVHGGLAEWMREQIPKDFLFDLAVVLHALRAGSKADIEDFKACRSDYHVKSPVSPPAPTSGGAASKPL